MLAKQDGNLPQNETRPANCRFGVHHSPIPSAWRSRAGWASTGTVCPWCCPAHGPRKAKGPSSVVEGQSPWEVLTDWSYILYIYDF